MVDKDKKTREEILKERKNKFYAQCKLRGNNCLTVGWIDVNKAISGTKIKLKKNEEFVVESSGDSILSYYDVVRNKNDILNKILDEY